MAEAQAFVLAGADERDLTQLSEYRAIGGYAALEKARGLTREQVASNATSGPIVRS